MARKLCTLQVTITEGRMTEEFVQANRVVSRMIEIRGDQTLNQLHWTIFKAFDRYDDCHLSEFHFGARPHDRHAARYVLPFIYDDPEYFGEPEPAGSTTRTRLSSLGLDVGSMFWYWYDFGGNWYHEIVVLGISEAEPKVKYPRVVLSVGNNPPQYPPLEGEPDDEEPD